MSLVSFTPVTDGSTATAASVNTPLSTLYNDYNGNITNANIATNAAIAGSKINYASLSNPYKFRVSLATATNSNNGIDTYVRIPFETRQYDTSSNVDISTTKGQFTAPVAGFYLFTYTVGMTEVGANTYEAGLFVNGTIYSRGMRDNVNTVEITIAGHDQVQLAANDTVYVGASSSATAAPISTGATKTYFTGFLISAT